MLFEKASRMKLRFATIKGIITVEDLWDLPLTTKSNSQLSLDELAKALNKQLKDAAQEESFVEKASAANEELHLSFDIVKHIIDIRLAENEAAKAKADAKAKKERIMDIIAKKQDAQLEGASLEELQEMVRTL